MLYLNARRNNYTFLKFVYESFNIKLKETQNSHIITN